MYYNVIINLLEYLGMVAFALSGVLVGVEYGFDYFGIVFLAVVTSVGGGMIRDVCLGIVPPVCLNDPIYVSIAIGTAVFAIIILSALKKKPNKADKHRFVVFISIFDALGLGSFSISSASVALIRFPDANVLLVTFVSLITAIGGGMIRDVLAARKPIVLRREIYALATIFGTVIYYYLNVWHFLPDEVTALVCVALIIAVRLFAMRKHLNMPRLDTN